MAYFQYKQPSIFRLMRLRYKFTIEFFNGKIVYSIIGVYCMQVYTKLYSTPTMLLN